MKKGFIARSVYSFLYWVDRKFYSIEDYSYETAPYCGHHYSGHNGHFTNSRYHEGDGQAQSSIRILGWDVISTNHTDEGWSICWQKKIYTTAKNGQECTPVYKCWTYHGNILFRKGFKNRLLFMNRQCVQFLGFRFTAWIGHKY